MNKWPAWFYGPRGEARIFDRREDVPAEWKDAPGGEPERGEPEIGETPRRARRRRRKR